VPSDTGSIINAAVTPAISGLEKHLAVCELSQSELEDAQFQGGTATLVKMVQNVHAVSRILEKLHLPGYQKGTTASSHHIFADGTKITLGQVLQHFKWSVATYQKKASAYKWATEAASWNYIKEVPGNYFYLIMILPCLTLACSGR